MSGDLQVELRQSTPFHSLHEELWLSLSRTTAVMSHVMEGRLRERRLSLTQYNVLRILRGAPEGLCQFEIRRRLVAQVPDVPRILERMEKGGFIKRVRSLEDRRLVIASLTEPGRSLVDDLDAPMGYWMQALFVHLSETEMQAIVDGLSKARASHMRNELTGRSPLRTTA